MTDSENTAHEEFTTVKIVLAGLLLLSLASWGADKAEKSKSDSEQPVYSLPKFVDVICHEMDHAAGESRILECLDRRGEVFRLIRPLSRQQTN